jgi:signal transduction histidine kinase
MNHQPTHTQKWKVLITDDQELIHVMIKHYLSDYQYQGAGLQFVDAFTGKEAMKILKEQSDIAVIVLDVMLEEADMGFKVVQYIRETLNNKLVKIIMLTGKLDFDNAQNFFMKYDIDMFCPKHDLDKIFFMITSTLRAYNNSTYTYHLHEKLKKELDLQKTAENNLKELNKKLEQMVHNKEVQLERTTSSLQEAIVYARQLTQEVEATSNAKSRFLANLSHEVRTPMNGILGMLSLSLESDLTPKQKEYISLAKHVADQMLFLISDILDFSKMEYDTLRIYNEIFQLPDIIESAIIPLDISAKENGVRLIYDIASDIPTYLYGAPDRLFQILINLMKNAIKFSEYCDVVIKAQINEKRLYEDNKDSHTEILFSVIDQGLGMNKDILDSIFKPFFQGHVGLSESKGGLGLGLSICKQLVEIMGGKIWAESTPGKGSTFYFILLFENLNEKQIADYESQKKINPSHLEGDIKQERITIPEDMKRQKSNIHQFKESDDNKTEQYSQLKIKGQQIVEQINQAALENDLAKIGKHVNHLITLASEAGEKKLSDNAFRCKLAVRKEDKTKALEMINTIKEAFERL